MMGCHMRSGPWVCIPIMVSIEHKWWEGVRGSGTKTCISNAFDDVLRACGRGSGSLCFLTLPVLAFVWLVVLLHLLEWVALALAVPRLVTELAGHVFGTIASRQWSRECWICCGNRESIRVRVTIDFLNLEYCFDLDLVKVSEQGQRGHEVGVLGSQGANHCHTGEFVIECGNVEWWATQILDSEHGPLNSSSQSRKGLLRAFSNAEELIICHKTAAGLLLDENLLQCTPSLCGIVLVCSDVDLLVCSNVEHELTSCSVLLDVPSSLIWACSGGARLLAIHKLPETFGAKYGLHLLTPGDIVGSSEGLDAMQVGLVFWGHGVECRSVWRWMEGKEWSKKFSLRDNKLRKNLEQLECRTHNLLSSWNPCSWSPQWETSIRTV